MEGQKEAKLNKQLFDVCDRNKGEGIFLHIIDNGKFEEEQSLRVYHSGGYCFDVCKERVDLAEDETNQSAIDGWEYSFFAEWEGFKQIDIEKAIKLLNESV